MAQFTVYKNTDGSAPAMDGTVSALIDVLDGCLVNGYGAKTAAGWTKPYTGTDLAAYLQGAGSGFYLRVNDAGPGAGAAKEARIIGYETMSDVNTGTGPFPTVAQMTNGMFVRKSVAADATARDWIVMADDRTAYVFIKSEVAVGVAGVWYAFMFGDFYSVVNADAYNCMIAGRVTENSATASVDKLDQLTSTGLINGTPPTANYFARGYTGVGGSVATIKVGNYSLAAQTTPTQLNGIVAYPNPSDGGMYISKVWIGDNTTAPTPSVRGWMRGFWHFCHPIASVADADTVSGTGDFAGKTFLFIKTSGNSGVYMIETSNTVDVN